MPSTVSGIVKEGKVIPQTPLPEGLQVQILLPEAPTVPADLQEELNQWASGSAEALELVDRLADEGREAEQ